MPGFCEAKKSSLWPSKCFVCLLDFYSSWFKSFVPQSLNVHVLFDLRQNKKWFHHHFLCFFSPFTLRRAKIPVLLQTVCSSPHPEGCQDISVRCLVVWPGCTGSSLLCRWSRAGYPPYSAGLLKTLCWWGWACQPLCHEWWASCCRHSSSAVQPAWWTPVSAWNGCSNGLWACRSPASLLAHWRLSTGSLGVWEHRVRLQCCMPPQLGKSKGNWEGHLIPWSCTSSRIRSCNSSTARSCLCLEAMETLLNATSLSQHSQILEDETRIVRRCNVQDVKMCFHLTD